MTAILKELDRLLELERAADVIAIEGNAAVLMESSNPKKDSSPEKLDGTDEGPYADGVEPLPLPDGPISPPVRNRQFTSHRSTTAANGTSANDTQQSNDFGHETMMVSPDAVVAKSGGALAVPTPPKVSSPPAKGRRVRFLPLSLLHIYTGNPSSSHAHVSRSGAPVLISRSPGISKYVLVHDQRGPVAMVHSSCISASARRIGFQLGILKDNIVVRAGSSGVHGAGSLREFINHKQSLVGGVPSGEPTTTASVASQVVISVVLQPLHDYQFMQVRDRQRGHSNDVSRGSRSRESSIGASQSSGAQSSPRSPRSRSISPRSRSPKLEKGVDHDIVSGAKLLMSLGLDNLVSTAAKQMLDNVSETSLIIELTEAKTLPAETDASGLSSVDALIDGPASTQSAVSRSRRDSTSSDISLASRGSTTSAASLSRPGVKLSSIRSRPTTVLSSNTSVRSDGQYTSYPDGSLPRTTRADAAASPLRVAPFHYAPWSPALGGDPTAVHRQFSFLQPYSTLGIGRVGAADSISCLHPGDIVLAVDDRVVAGCTAQEVTDYIADQAVEDGVMIKVARPVAVVSSDGISGAELRSKSTSARMTSSTTAVSLPRPSTSQRTPQQPMRSLSRGTTGSATSAGPVSRGRSSTSGGGGGISLSTSFTRTPKGPVSLSGRSLSAQPRKVGAPPAKPTPVKGTPAKTSTNAPLRSTSRSSAMSAPARPSVSRTAPQPVARSASRTSLTTPSNAAHTGAMAGRPASNTRSRNTEPRRIIDPTTLGLSRAAAAAFTRAPSTPSRIPQRSPSTSSASTAIRRTPSATRTATAAPSGPRPSSMAARPTNTSVLAAQAAAERKRIVSPAVRRPVSAGPRAGFTPTGGTPQRPGVAPAASASTALVASPMRRPVTAASGATSSPAARIAQPAPRPSPAASRTTTPLSRSSSRPRNGVGSLRSGAPSPAGSTHSGPVVIPTIRGGRSTKPDATATPIPVSARKNDSAPFMSPLISALTQDIDTALAQSGVATPITTNGSTRTWAAESADHAPATAELLGALADLTSQLEDVA